MIESIHQTLLDPVTIQTLWTQDVLVYQDPFSISVFLNGKSGVKQWKSIIPLRDLLAKKTANPVSEKSLLPYAIWNFKGDFPVYVGGTKGNFTVWDSSFNWVPDRYSRVIDRLGRLYAWQREIGAWSFRIDAHAPNTSKVGLRTVDPTTPYRLRWAKYGPKRSLIRIEFFPQEE